MTIDPLVTYSFSRANGGGGVFARRILASHQLDVGVSMDTVDTQALEEKIDHLIRICDKLEVENRSLRDQQTSLIAERAALVEKSELARSRVKAMITRLRAMEAGT